MSVVKAVLIVGAFLVAGLVGASPLPSYEVRKALPASMTCMPADLGALSPSHHGKPLLITDLNAKDVDPNSDIDEDSAEFSISGGVIRFDFNNGCDDDYDFIFFGDDLVNLAKGTVKEAHGLLSYFNAYGDSPDNGYSNSGTTLVTCVLSTATLPR